MIEKWHQRLDKEGWEVKWSITNWSLKAFDCFLDDLLIAKVAVAAYGFDYDSLVFVQSYLSERQQRTKVKNACSTYSDIL